MCRIVNDKVFDNIPKELTAKVIRKHFPQCQACPAGNMAQRDIPKRPLTVSFCQERSSR